MPEVASLANKYTLLQSWQAKKAELDALKLAESQLRAEVLAAFSEHVADELFSGVENIDIGQGYDLKITHALSYKLDNANDFERTDEALDAIEKLDNGELLAERLVKRKLELSVSEYKKLPPAAKKIIDRVLTITNAAPTVAIAQRKK